MPNKSIESTQGELLTLMDLNAIGSPLDFLLEGNVSKFVDVWEELHDAQRKFSWKFDNFYGLVEWCQKKEFNGKYETPELNAYYIWEHENAHVNETKKLGVNSAVRIAELDEPKHSKYRVYTDISAAELVLKVGSKPSKVLKAMSGILLAPSKIGLGYPKEENLGKLIGRKSKQFAIKEALGLSIG